MQSIGRDEVHLPEVEGRQRTATDRIIITETRNERTTERRRPCRIHVEVGMRQAAGVARVLVSAERTDECGNEAEAYAEAEAETKPLSTAQHQRHHVCSPPGLRTDSWSEHRGHGPPGLKSNGAGSPFCPRSHHPCCLRYSFLSAVPHCLPCSTLYGGIGPHDQGAIRCRRPPRRLVRCDEWECMKRLLCTEAVRVRSVTCLREPPPPRSTASKIHRL
jgi:hypothetical protein